MPKSIASSSPAADSTQLPIASVKRRLAALVYDAFLLFGLWVVPLFVITALLNARQPMPEQGVAHELPSIAPQPVLLLYMIAVAVGFYSYFWRQSGQTLGMQAWRIRVDSVDGGRPSWRQCLTRAGVGLLSLLCAGCGYWWIWIDKDRASWHDRASNTRVVVLPKKN